MHGNGPGSPGDGTGVSARTVRKLGVRVAGRRMFSDLSSSERRELVATACAAYLHAWGPAGRPTDLESWLATGMYAAMMRSYRELRMLRAPLRPAGAAALTGLLEEWLAAESLPSGSAVDDELMDRFLRQLSPADARLLWLQCEGYTREEIGGLLGVRPNAVSVRLHRLRVRLRDTVAPVESIEPTESATGPATETGAGGAGGRASGRAGGRDSGHGAA